MFAFRLTIVYLGLVASKEFFDIQQGICPKGGEFIQKSNPAEIVTYCTALNWSDCTGFCDRGNSNLQENFKFYSDQPAEYDNNFIDTKDVDINGYDLHSITLSGNREVDIGTCKDHCIAENECRSFQYFSPLCHLKSVNEDTILSDLEVKRGNRVNRRKVLNGSKIFYDQHDQLSIGIIVSDRIRSYQIVSDRIRSYQIVSDRIRSYQIVSDRIRSYQIVSDRIRSYQIVSDRIRSYQIVSDEREATILDETWTDSSYSPIHDAPTTESIVASSLLSIKTYPGSLISYCKVNHDCKAFNSHCSDGRCHCLDGYNVTIVGSKTKQCSKLVKVGEDCTAFDKLPPSSTCSNGLVECVPNKRANDYNTSCVQELLEKCSDESHCSDEHAECSDGICKCISKYDLNFDDSTLTCYQSNWNSFSIPDQVFIVILCIGPGGILLLAAYVLVVVIIAKCQSKKIKTPEDECSLEIPS
ncbi:hypothetical protein GQR58_023704 [Nymphon striatum]|nr:hypothetical protein GQR58_023704 [Nymphon striatum]